MIHAATPPNIISFDNQSGEPALVKLMGTSSHAVTVANGQKATVNAAAGDYYILVQYGNKAEGYRFTKGDPFTVTQTGNQYSIIRITLHPVVAGNYETKPISQAEFEQAQIGEWGEEERLGDKAPGPRRELASAATMPNPKKAEPQDSLPATITGKDGAPMALIPKGEFWMGTGVEEMEKLIQECVRDGVKKKGECKGWYEDEMPQHRVVLDAFSLDQYEVTNSRFKAFVKTTGYRTLAEKIGRVMARAENNREWLFDEDWETSWRKPDGAKTVLESNWEKHPVVQIAWEDAKAYCQWADKRLPTEAEFEYANRAGTKTRFWWGNGNPGSRPVANIRDETAKRKFTDWKFIMTGYDDGYSKTAPVGSYEANPWGLYDLTGNVWEWATDWYAQGYYQESPPHNPKGPSDGDYKVSRGGAWNSKPREQRAAVRGGPSSRYTRDLGFRCAQDAR